MENQEIRDAKILHTLKFTKNLPLAILGSLKTVEKDVVDYFKDKKPLKGDKGERGLQGLKGDIGPIGPKGSQGFKGEQGLLGPKGELGPKGDRGENGLIGPKGIDGKDGSPDTGAEIVNKINQLNIEPRLQIDASHIKDFTTRTLVSSGGGRFLPQSLDITDTPTFSGLKLSTFTKGSILFIGDNGLVTQNNTNLFWDNTNNRLGIGTTAPSTLLHVGLAGTTLGTIGVAGNTSGLVTIQPAAIAGSWTFTLPTTGGTNNYALTTNGSGVSTWSQVSLTAGVTGVLPIANGGTNSSTALLGNTIMISNGSAIVQGSAGTTTTVLHGNAVGSPSYSAVSLTADVTGTLPVANGGTGAVTLTSNGILYGNGISAVQITAQGGTNTVLVANAGAPSFSTNPTVSSLTLTAGSSGSIFLPASAQIRASGSGDRIINFTDSAGNSTLTLDHLNVHFGIGSNMVPATLWHMQAIGGISGGGVCRLSSLNSALSPVYQLMNDTSNQTQQTIGASGLAGNYGDTGFTNANTASWLYSGPTTGGLVFDSGAGAVNTSIAFVAGNASKTRLFIKYDGTIGLNTVSPTNDLSFGGNVARILWMERHTTANTAGNNLTIQAGGATSGATNKSGGSLILAPGVSTGSGTGRVITQFSPNTAAATIDNTLATGTTLFEDGGIEHGTGSTTPGKYRIALKGGTAVATTDWALSAGWGANATVSAVSGNDSRGTITVTTSALDTPTANPTLTLTFKDGTWTSAPFAVANMDHNSTGPSTVPVTSKAAVTTLVLSYRGTPTATSALTYIFNYFVVG